MNISAGFIAVKNLVERKKQEGDNGKVIQSNTLWYKNQYIFVTNNHSTILNSLFYCFKRNDFLFEREL